MNDIVPDKNSFRHHLHAISNKLHIVKGMVELVRIKLEGANVANQPNLTEKLDKALAAIESVTESTNALRNLSKEKGLE